MTSKKQQYEIVEGMQRQIDDFFRSAETTVKKLKGYDYDDNLYSDLYKDARGVRPTPEMIDYWNNKAVPKVKQQMWDMLNEELTYSEHYISDEEMQKRRLV